MSVYVIEDYACIYDHIKCINEDIYEDRIRQIIADKSLDPREKNRQIDAIRNVKKVADANKGEGKAQSKMDEIREKLLNRNRAINAMNASPKKSFA